MKRSILFALLAVLAAGTLTGCATTPTKTASAEELYKNAADAMRSHNYTVAAENFEQLESQYPFGQYVTKAQLGLISAYYKKNEPESAIATAERFIRINPQHENADYAYYLKGLARFDSHKTYFQRFLPIDTTMRDQTVAKQAFDDFSELVKRFPKSPYVADAKERMVYLKNHVAMSEYHIAEYYFDRKAYAAAVERTKTVIKHYPQTPAVALALGLQSKAYSALGLKDLAANSYNILQQSYPKLLEKPEKKKK